MAEIYESLITYVEGGVVRTHARVDPNATVYLSDGVYLAPDDGYHVAIISTSIPGHSTEDDSWIALDEEVWSNLQQAVAIRRATRSAIRRESELSNNLEGESDGAEQET